MMEERHLMKRIFLLTKYYWHRFQFTINKIIIADCKDERLILQLEKKINYHEKLALIYLAKIG